MVMPSLFEELPMTGVETYRHAVCHVFSDTITREVDVMGSPFCRWRKVRQNGRERRLRSSGTIHENWKEQDEVLEKSLQNMDLISVCGSKGD